MSELKLYGKLEKYKYLTHFVLRAFMIAVFCVVGVSALVLSCYFVDLFINVKKGNTNNPLFGAYVIVSPSMVPTIKVNDAIVVKRVDNDMYNVGDIITFSSADVHYQGLTVTHRIVDKDSYSSKESVYTTKGDNNSIVDPASVKTSAIYGKVMFKIPKLGYIQSYLSKPSNFFLCILIPSLIVLLYDGYRILSMVTRKVEA